MMMLMPRMRQPRTIPRATFWSSSISLRREKGSTFTRKSQTRPRMTRPRTEKTAGDVGGCFARFGETEVRRGDDRRGAHQRRVRILEDGDVGDRQRADRLSKVQGVAATSTHIAFRTYSKHDLEAAFSLGLD